MYSEMTKKKSFLFCWIIAGWRIIKHTVENIAIASPMLRRAAREDRRCITQIICYILSHRIYIVDVYTSMLRTLSMCRRCVWGILHICVPRRMFADCCALLSAVCLYRRLNSIFQAATKIPRVVYNFKQADFSALRSLITNRSLNTSLNHSTHMNEAWSIWNSTVTEHINQCIPRVPVKNSFKHPWMDGEVRHMHNCKHTAWAAAKRTNNVQMWNKFKCLRNKLKLMIRDKHNSFMSDLALSLKNNAERFWIFCRLNTNSRQIPVVVSHGQNDVTVITFTLHFPLQNRNCSNCYFT